MSISEKPLRGITSWERAPSQWNFELFETYKKLVSLDLEQLKNLDNTILDSCGKIAIYFTDRSKGISITDAELGLLRNRINRPLSDVSNHPQKIDKASVVYKALHPAAKDLPKEMMQQIFGFLEDKQLVRAAHKTSIQTKTQICENISLQKRIDWAVRKNKICKIIHLQERIAWIRKIGREQAAYGDETRAQCTFASAYDIAKSLDFKRTKERVYEQIAKDHAKSVGVKGAVVIVAKLKDLRNKACAYCGIVEVQAKREGAKGAIVIADMIEDKEAKSRAYYYIVRALVKSKDMDGAIDMVAKISDKDSQDDAYNVIAEAYAYSGDVDLALFYARQIHSEHKRAAYIAIARAQLKCGDVVAAEVSANIYGNDEIHYEICLHKLNNGDLAGAIARTHSISLDTNLDRAYRDIARAYVKSGNMIDAVIFAQKISNSRGRSSVYSAIAHSYIRNGDLNAARAISGEITDQDQKHVFNSAITQAQAASVSPAKKVDGSI